MATRYVAAHQKEGARRPLYLTDISVPMSSQLKLARTFDTMADADRAVADYLDEHVFQKPWLATGWKIVRVNREDTSDA